MLLISGALTAGGILRYHTREWSAAASSYFSEGRRVEGQFHGRLAEELGLRGAITDEQFHRLAHGQHPLTGRQLIFPRTGKAVDEGRESEHRAGWDFTFSANKPVSMTMQDPRVLQAHRLAVYETANFLESNIQARMGGNRFALQTGKWIGVMFEHHSARPVDGYPAPDLHTHLIVFNLTAEGKGGQARSIDPHALYSLQTMASRIYQNRLHAELLALGYQIQQGKNFAPEIQGYSREYVEAESARSQVIDAELKRRGLQGRAASGQIARETREEKLDLAPGELQALHRARAEAFGQQPERVIAEARERQARGIELETVSAERAVDWAIRRLSSRHSVIERHGYLQGGGLLQNALEYAQGHITVESIEQEIDRRKVLTAADRAAGETLPELVRVSHYRTHAPGERYATREMIRMEREVIERVLWTQGRYQPIAATLTKDEFREAYRQQLNDNQMHMIWSAMHSTDQIFGVQGVAGARKTSSMSLFAKIAEDHGYRVQGLTPTSRPVQELARRGVKAETLAAHVSRLKAKQRGELAWSRRDHTPTMYLLDEATLADIRSQHYFLHHLKTTDRVMAIGDRKQHDSIEAGRTFAQLQDAGMLTLRLDRITRQEKTPELLECVKLTYNNRISDAIRQLAAMGCIVEEPHREHRFAALIAKFVQAPDRTLIVSPDNDSRVELNEMARAELRKLGRLRGIDVRAQTLVNRQELYTEDTTRAASYRINDHVRFGKTARAFPIPRGSYARVLATDTEANTITVEDRRGQLHTFNPEAVRLGLTVYRPETRAFAAGDRVQFTGQWKQQGVANRSLGTIETLDARGNVQLRLDPLTAADNGRLLRFNLHEFAHLDHGYAMTSFSAQSATYEIVLGQIDGGDSRSRQLVDKKMLYVMMSRASMEFRLFTDSRASLERAVNRLELKPLALSREQIREYRDLARSA